MSDDERFRNAVIYGTSHPEMYMTPEQAEIERLRAENENLRAALKPFAVEEQVIHRWYSSDVFPYVPDDHPVLSNKITVGDLRAAATALKETE